MGVSDDPSRHCIVGSASKALHEIDTVKSAFRKGYDQTKFKKPIRAKKLSRLSFIIEEVGVIIAKKLEIACDF